MECTFSETVGYVECSVKFSLVVGGVSLSETYIDPGCRSFRQTGVESYIFSDSEFKGKQ